MRNGFNRQVSGVVLALAVGLAAPVWAVAADGPSELVGERIGRFFAPGTKPADALPSMALQRPLTNKGALPKEWAVKPVFTKLADGRYQATIELAKGTSLYGTGEVAGPLLRNGRTVETWNLDAYGYTPESKNLYKSHPWVLAVRADGSAFGVLADTTYRLEMQTLEDRIVLTADGPAFPVIIVDRPSAREVVKGLGELVGTMPLPPLWAIGYHQCRYSYNPEARVREVAAGFRKNKIPCDVIWFDIDYMAGYRVFTYNPVEFPDPKKLNSDLAAQGFHKIYMIDPGLKSEDTPSANDPSPEVLKNAGPAIEQAWKRQIEYYRQLRAEGDRLDVWVKTAKGEVFRGAVWPGLCVFPDYTSDKVRTWWAGLYKDFMSWGIDGVWNDMNEPAVFNVPTKTMPEDNQHRGGVWSAGPGLPEVKITPGPHARFHNVYGMLMAQGTFDGIAAANPGKRPFVLTRATYLGGHRYAASWTGDNSANWNDLEQSIPMALNLGMSGQAFCGPDIGGFIGNGPGKPADRDLKGEFFARWLGIGSLLPFSRGHTAKGNDNKEPFAYNEAVTKACRLALERRYRLLPYFYTLFEESSREGLPVARPMFWADPTDPALRSEDDCFLVGDGLLVAPQLMPDRTRVNVMPKGIWRKAELVGEGDHPWLPTLKVRGGHIVPMGPIVQHTGERPLDELTLLVSLDEKGEATGTLYEDAGDGYGYRQGDFLRTTYSAKAAADGTVTVQVAKTEGQRARINRPIEVIVLGDGGKVFKATGRDGVAVSVPTK
jgi:alpha-glucosidase